MNETEQKPEVGNEETPEDSEMEGHKSDDGDFDCYAMPEGVEGEEGSTIKLPTETEFTVRDGNLRIYKVSTIDGKPAQTMPDNYEEEEGVEKNEGDELAKESEMWRNKAKEKDQLAMGNI